MSDEDRPETGYAAGPAFVSPWQFLRGSVVFPVHREDGRLLAGSGPDGSVMWVCFTDLDAARAGMPEGYELKQGHVFEVLGNLPPGSGVWVDPGTPRWSTLLPDTVDELRPHATLVPWLASLVWEDFPRIEQGKGLRKELNRAAKSSSNIQALWLLGFQLQDAKPEGVVVVVPGADAGAAINDVMAALDRALGATPDTLGAISVTTFASLPGEAQQLVQRRLPVYSRIGVPKFEGPARNAVRHLSAVLVAEEARGNTVASLETALIDGQPAAVLKYPLDVDAIDLEFLLTDGHELRQQGDRWAVVCPHGDPSLLGGTESPGKWAQRAQRGWWKRWNKKPREKVPTFLQ
ncbi:hypothetical protein [Knoellia koreensis]|uniref:Uncharacterized protein n=1 Tax=Knoellia koreensis TaxID=2730921 RepID=A0A849HAG9_9MICO|nr:hypothetical protein [Knoellia sp. DB2414S]NNM44408.1 hypothetical protein [Knoellia sp. DB2414S]